MACRMFGYCGNSESDVHELYASLKQACANDPNLCAVAPGCSAHCHGWGYVINADNGLFHYRSAKSIYEDKIVLPKLEGKIRAIFHGRYASKPDLAGHIFAHPFMAADNSKVTFFAHNGGVNAPGLPERKVDSEWAMDEVIAAGGLAQALPKLKEHTGSALNLLVLTIDRKKDTPALLEYFHFFKPKEPGKVNYYSMFEREMPGGRALVSSTIAFPDGKITPSKEFEPAKFNELVSLET